MNINSHKLSEQAVIEYVKTFLLNKPDGNWHENKVREKCILWYTDRRRVRGSCRMRDVFLRIFAAG